MRERVGLYDAADTQLRSFPGMLQRVGILRKPSFTIQILFLDEPCGPDPGAGAKCVTLIQSSTMRGKTDFLATQSSRRPETLLTMPRRLYLNQRELRGVGIVADLLASHGSSSRWCGKAVMSDALSPLARIVTETGKVVTHRSRRVEDDSARDALRSANARIIPLLRFSEPWRLLPKHMDQSPKRLHQQSFAR